MNDQARFGPVIVQIYIPTGALPAVSHFELHLLISVEVFAALDSQLCRIHTKQLAARSTYLYRITYKVWVQLIAILQLQLCKCLIICAVSVHNLHSLNCHELGNIRVDFKAIKPASPKFDELKRQIKVVILEYLLIGEPAVYSLFHGDDVRVIDFEEFKQLLGSVRGDYDEHDHREERSHIGSVVVVALVGDADLIPENVPLFPVSAKFEYSNLLSHFSI